MPDRLSRLKRRLSVAYEFGLPDQRTLADGIYRQRVEAWRQSMTEQAASVGSRRRGVAPAGKDQRELMQQSQADAVSIAKTFNADLDREIERLYLANPDGDRAYYVNALTGWADQRAAWKDRQIALWNNKTARNYAMQRFDEMNKVGAGLFVFTGPPAVCDDCEDQFVAGQVDRAHVDANPTPLHLNCPHEWTRTRARVGVPLDRLWVGA